MQWTSLLTLPVSVLPSALVASVQIPEDFISAGGMTAAVVAAVEHVISELQSTGRLPPAPPDRTRPRVSGTLTLQAIGHAGRGSDLTKWDRVYQYEVRGLPPGERAWIANFGSRHEENWKILRARNGVQGDWSGDLNRRFPPSDFPVNIDVVGAQDCTYAVVQILLKAVGSFRIQGFRQPDSIEAGRRLPPTFNYVRDASPPSGRD